MTDSRFHDIVIESTEMMGPEGEYHTAVCKTCSTKHKVTKDSFEIEGLRTLVSIANDEIEWKQANALDREDNYKDVLRYVAEMRAWNCHHEGEEPIDGLPDEPEVSRVDFGGR